LPGNGKRLLACRSDFFTFGSSILSLHKVCVPYLLQVCLLVSLCCLFAPACLGVCAMFNGAVCLLACLLTIKGVHTNTTDNPQLCEGCHIIGTKKSCSWLHLTPLQQCSLFSCTVSCLAMLQLALAACQQCIKAEEPFVCSANTAKQENIATVFVVQDCT